MLNKNNFLQKQKILPLGTIDGVIWKFATPKEGSIFWIDFYAITSALAHKPFLKKVAEEWINRTDSFGYQGDYLVRRITDTGNKATGDLLTGSGNSRYHVGESASGAKFILPPPRSRRDRNGLKLLWKEAIKGIEFKTSDKK